MSFDRVKVSKVETILAGLTPTEQIHIAAFAAKLCGSAPPAVNPALAAAAAAAPAPTHRTYDDILREQMAAFKLGDLVEFTNSRNGEKVQGRVVRKNHKTLGLDNRWRVSPSLCRLVGKHPPLPTPGLNIVRTGVTGLPTAAGAGNW
jgi:hypothetical protein